MTPSSLKNEPVGPPSGSVANIQTNILTAGEVYGDRITQVDMRIAKLLKFGRSMRVNAGLDIYNLANSNTVLFYNTTYVPSVTGWQTPLAYMNPRVFRLAAEFAW